MEIINAILASIGFGFLVGSLVDYIKYGNSSDILGIMINSFTIISNIYFLINYEN